MVFFFTISNEQIIEFKPICLKIIAIIEEVTQMLTQAKGNYLIVRHFVAYFQKSYIGDPLGAML